MQRRKEKQPSDQTIAVFSNVTPWVLQYKKMWGSCFSCTATSHIFVLDYVTIKELLSKFLTRQQKKKEKKKRHFAYNPISAYFPCTSVFHLYALVHCKISLLAILHHTHTHTTPTNGHLHEKTECRGHSSTGMCFSVIYTLVMCYHLPFYQHQVMFLALHHVWF